MRVQSVVVGLVFVAFSGCFASEEGGPASASEDTVGPSVGLSAASNTTAPAPASNRAPTANLSASVLNGSAPLNVTFGLNGTDEDGDVLTWTLTADGANVTAANGTGLPANVTFTFTVVGNFTVNLTVFDSASNATANVTIAVLGSAALPAPVSATDPGGDSTTDFTDCVGLTVSMTEVAIVGVVTVDTLWPTTAVLTPVSYSFAINDVQFDSFARYPQDANPMTWNGAAYMPSGTSKWDAATKSVTFTIPLEWLADNEVTAPYMMHGAANFGGLAVTEEDDRVPNTGDLTFG